jgi:hypothetical protein
LCRELDEHVEQFRTRPLDGAYPYLWLDAKQVKVRDRGRVVFKALVIAYGVHECGRREALGLDLGEVESEALTEFLRSLRSRGLEGLRLVVSGHHEGLKTAIARLARSDCRDMVLLTNAVTDRRSGRSGAPAPASRRGPVRVLARRRARRRRATGRRRAARRSAALRGMSCSAWSRPASR